MTRNHPHARPVEFANNTQGFRYRLGLSVVAWCMGTLTTLMFMPGKLDVLNVVVTPQSTLLGAVVLGLLGIKGYQDFQRSGGGGWQRNSYDGGSSQSRQDGDGSDGNGDGAGRGEGSGRAE